ncbi:MAG: BON domain-containing protein [Thermodesulfobacteriota bacterium]
MVRRSPRDERDEASTAAVLGDIRRQLQGEPRFGARGEIGLALEDGVLTLEGEVRDVAVKKLLLERAAAYPGISAIVDRLRVTPAQRMGDGAILDHVRDALLEEPALSEAALREIRKGETATVREPPGARGGDVTIAVENGVVTLTGALPSLARKRLAGVLAWWVPGTRDVVNGIEVTPPEEDSDEEISDAVRIALEKDPFVDASQLRVTTRSSVVELEGIVPKDAERDMAERDAWCVFGVDGVENRIEVRAGPATGGAPPRI